MVVGHSNTRGGGCTSHMGGGEGADVKSRPIR